MTDYVNIISKIYICIIINARTFYAKFEKDYSSTFCFLLTDSLSFSSSFLFSFCNKILGF